VKTVKLGKKLGEGASGARYLAQLELADGTLVPVVVKRMLRPSEEATEGFLRRVLEAMNRAQPEQSTLIRAGGNLFMVQKFFSPDTLKSVIDGPEPRRRKLAPKVLESSLEQLERITAPVSRTTTSNRRTCSFAPMAKRFPSTSCSLVASAIRKRSRKAPTSA
jgi:hypothetical protein